ncbi:MAG: histidine kinase [Chloroflexia bacterium]
MSETERLEKRLADLRARLPRHSVPPSMLQEIEELEEELARRRRQEEQNADLRIRVS